MLRRLIVVVFGFCVAAGVGATLFFFAVLLDPALREAGFNAAIAAAFAWVDQGLDDESAGPFAAFGLLIWTVFLAACVAPLALAALIGEAAGTRSVIWYAGASGFLSGAAPFILRAAHGHARAANALEQRVALTLFLTGAAVGAVYWLLAGRNAGRAPARIAPPPPAPPRLPPPAS